MSHRRSQEGHGQGIRLLNVSKMHISEYGTGFNVYYTGERICLPAAYRDWVEQHWDSLMREGKGFFRGDGYTITDVHDKGMGNIDVFVQLTDYAHFIYSVRNGFRNAHDCRVIHTSALIETADGKYVLGEMNGHTAFPGKLQFIGGGIDQRDLFGDRIDLDHNIRSEIAEELGVDVSDGSMVKTFTRYAIKSGGDNNVISAIYKLTLKSNEAELIAMFAAHNEKISLQNGKPEIRSLFFVNLDRTSVEQFVYQNTQAKDGNIIPTLMVASGIKPFGRFVA
jgi:8-oxo-dGTP pyrophosphatase MutT (NUDIX family)